jgi:molybdopterin-guanine dinucleotide biosynthesis protein A
LCEYLRAARLGGVRKVVQWTDSHDGRLAMFPIDQLDPFFNVKIPEDLAQAKAMI